MTLLKHLPQWLQVLLLHPAFPILLFIGGIAWLFCLERPTKTRTPILDRDGKEVVTSLVPKWKIVLYSILAGCALALAIWLLIKGQSPKRPLVIAQPQYPTNVPPQGPQPPPPESTSQAEPAKPSKRKSAPSANVSKPSSPSGGPSVGSVTVQQGGAVSIGQQGGITAGQVNINAEPAPNPVVPEISVTTQDGLALSDFPNLVVSAEMMRHLRRHILTVRNTNTIDLHNFAMRFQLPEPVFGNLLIEDRPAGIEIIWHACRISFALTGEGASAAPIRGGGTTISTGGTPGSVAALYGNGEVCSAAMDNEKLLPTGIHQLQIARIPAVTAIRLAFLTSDGPDGSRYLETREARDSEPASFIHFGDGRFQYSSGGHTETRDVFLPLRFDGKLRVINSLPSSGEHGKWKIEIMTTN
jgi:hypothetical protein